MTHWCRPLLVLATLWLGVTTLWPGVMLFAAEPDPQVDVGDMAIDFQLPIVGGDGSVKLSEQYAKGPVVVIVLRGYPGYQCPICSSQVSALANRSRGLAQAAEKVILVYPGERDELTRHADEFLGSRSLPKPLVMVRDDDMKMVNQWGLRWNAPRETAYPSTFIIDSDGKVVWKLVSNTHLGRSTADQILKELRKLDRQPEAAN